MRLPPGEQQQPLEAAIRGAEAATGGSHQGSSSSHRRQPSGEQQQPRDAAIRGAAAATGGSHQGSSSNHGMHPSGKYQQPQEAATRGAAAATGGSHQGSNSSHGRQPPKEQQQPREAAQRDEQQQKRKQHLQEEQPFPHPGLKYNVHRAGSGRKSGSIEMSALKGETWRFHLFPPICRHLFYCVDMIISAPGTYTIELHHLQPVPSLTAC